MSKATSIRNRLSFRNIGGIYVWIALVAIFGIWQGSTFLSGDTVTTVANQYSITGILALSLVIPLAAGLFDLSIAYTANLAGIVVALLLADTSMGFGYAILIGLGIGLLVGLINGIVVVILGIDSFIGTLATGSILAAIAIAVSNEETITGRVGDQFSEVVAHTSLLGFTAPVFYMLVLMVVLGIVLERTKSGRFMYAIGYQRETARLAGVPVKRLRMAAFMISGVIAAFGGMVLVARIGAASANIGTPYLLPAFAAAFLGATQFRGGRFNAWGTVLAVLLLGTASYGLLVSGAPQWMPHIFEGLLLIVAVALTQLELRGRVWRALPRRTRRERKESEGAEA